jgi:hypothetical protein
MSWKRLIQKEAGVYFNEQRENGNLPGARIAKARADG